MKYAFLLCILPFFAQSLVAQKQDLPKFSISVKGGMFNTMNKKIEVNTLVNKISFDSINPPTQLELSLMFKLKNRHYLSFGMSRINYHYWYKDVGPCGFVGPCFIGDARFDLNLLSYNINHSYLLLSAPKTRLFILNGIQTNFGKDQSYFEKSNSRSFGYRAELLFQLQVWKHFSIALSPFCSKSISKYHRPFDYKPFNYGLMIGISKTG